MSENRQLFIGLCLAATWLKGQGPRPGDRQGGDGDFYVALAQAAERARIDFVFKPDALFLHPAMAAGPAGFEGIDPTILLAAIARETRRIGLVTTISTTFNPPYVVARQLQSLHWVSGGRAGWNIVTSIEGAENFGEAAMPSAQARYRRAEEFTEVVRRLWRSHPGVSAGGGAAPVDHAGEFFRVKGPLSVPAHPSGPMPLFQAGSSDTGRDFAASVADAIFAAAPDMAAGIELRDDLRRRAVARGRAPDAVRVLPGLYLFLGGSRAEAQAQHARAHAHLGHAQRCEAVRGILGLDVARLPTGSRVTADMLPDPAEPVRSRTHADLLRRFIERSQPTVEVLLARPEVVGSAHWVAVGTVADVLKDIVAWFEAGAMDGFIAMPGGSAESLRLFLDELVPALAARGLFRREYEGGTLREHLRIR